MITFGDVQKACDECVLYTRESPKYQQVEIICKFAGYLEVISRAIDDTEKDVQFSHVELKKILPSYGKFGDVSFEIQSIGVYIRDVNFRWPVLMLLQKYPIVNVRNFENEPKERLYLLFITCPSICLTDIASMGNYRTKLIYSGFQFAFQRRFPGFDDRKLYYNNNIALEMRTKFDPELMFKYAATLVAKHRRTKPLYEPKLLKITLRDAVKK